MRTALSKLGEPALTTRVVEKGIQQQPRRVVRQCHSMVMYEIFDWR